MWNDLDDRPLRRVHPFEGGLTQLLGPFSSHQYLSMMAQCTLVINSWSKETSALPMIWMAFWRRTFEPSLWMLTEILGLAIR